MLLPGFDVQIFPAALCSLHTVVLNCVGARIEFEVFDMHFTPLFSVHQIAARVISLHLHNLVSVLTPPLQAQTPFKYLLGPSVSNNFLKVRSNYDFILHFRKCFLLYSAAVDCCRTRNTQGCVWLLVPTAYEIKVLLIASKWYSMFNTCTNVVVTAGIEAEVKKAFQEKHEAFGFVHLFQ
jgi:hypothetical protein